MADICVTLLVCYDPLPDELIHHVGQVGQYEDDDDRHGQVSCLDHRPGHDNLVVSHTLVKQFTYIW